jgi:hypothetical protein
MNVAAAVVVLVILLLSDVTTRAATSGDTAQTPCRLTYDKATPPVAFLERISTDSEYRQVLRETGIRTVTMVKFIIDRQSGTTTPARMYYQNTSVYSLHADFATAHVAGLRGKTPADIYRVVDADNGGVSSLERSIGELAG